MTFWVVRMILMTTCLRGEVPFKTVYLHGLVRDEQGRKMSKSLDNIIDPLDVSEKFGTDAVRLSLMVGSSPGNDSKLSEEKIGSYRNFANKLWNIARFIQLTINNEQLTLVREVSLPKANTLADKWILTRLDQVISEVTEHIEQYRFSPAAETLRDFTWNEFADWYLEIAKIEGNKTAVLNYVLNTVLKLWHPYMPYVTEAIWQELYGEEHLLMVEHWPSVPLLTKEGAGEVILEKRTVVVHNPTPACRQAGRLTLSLVKGGNLLHRFYVTNMATQKKPWDFLTQDERKHAIDKIMTFFAEERDEEIGVIAAEEILDMCLELLGPKVYNDGVLDAKDWFKKQLGNLELDYDLLKK
ncbi:MAG TPA: hypothetical protein DIS59_01045 [Candidatus Magasanikbacteria bacterium]|nr:hypothetical protein [Candidatus Magasanikbacteria bacterium]